MFIFLLCLIFFAQNAVAEIKLFCPTYVKDLQECQLDKAKSNGQYGECNRRFEDFKSFCKVAAGFVTGIIIAGCVLGYKLSIIYWTLQLKLEV